MGLIFQNFTYDLLVLAATLITLAYFYVKSKLKYFSERNIPHFCSSFLESLKLFVFFSDMRGNTKLLYNKAKDAPYSGFFQLLNPAFIVRDPSLVQKIMIKDFSYFQDHGFEIDEKTSPLEGHLFNMKGDKWRLLRYKLAPTFTSGKLKLMLPLMEESADRIINDMRTKKYEDIFLKDVLREYGISVIATCAFGIDGASVSDPNSRFRKILDRFFKPSIIDMVRVSSRIVCPSLAKRLKIKFVSSEVDDFFISLTKEAFEIRKTTGFKRNDFIQLLLELKEKGSVEIDSKDLEEDEKHILTDSQIHNSQHPSEKLDFTDELLSAQTFVFWLAGYENSATVLAMITYMIAKNKDIQDRVRNEIKEMRDKHGGLNYAALKDMKLLDACLSESLRMYSPGVTHFRRCNKDYVLDDGTTIEKGTTVFIPATCIQYDPKYWNKPEEFNPDRFLGNDKLIPGTYTPFGEGPRICIAQRFVLLETKIMLAKLIEAFELIPSMKTKEPLKFEKLNRNNVVGGLWMSLKPCV